MKSCARLIKTYGCLAALFLISACREVIEVDLPNEEPQVVIEGFLTYWEQNPARSNATVTVSTTGNYYDENDFNPATDASVAITDLTDNTVYPLTTDENMPGVYTNEEIPVSPGHSYRLQVNRQEQTYEATGTVLPVARVDSFTYRYQPKRGFLDEGYYLYFSGRTPKERGINYYRFILYEDDSIYNEPEDYLIQDDEVLKAQIDTLQLANYAFEAGDTVRIEMYSLNKGIYEYYNELLELLFNDGGLFSSPPRNPTTNIENMTDSGNPPLGFFQVSTAVDGEVVIEDQ